MLLLIHICYFHLQTFKICFFIYFQLKISAAISLHLFPFQNFNIFCENKICFFLFFISGLNKEKVTKRSFFKNK